LLNFLLPELFDNSDIFDNWFNLNSSKEGVDEEEMAKKNVEIINSLHRILRPFILRRTKEDMDKALPPKKEIQLYTGLTKV
jgi:SNF2 family DNA or RNA helicase